MKPETTKLTKRLIDAAGYEGDGNSRDVRWDSLLPGFGIRLYPSGKKSFVLSYRADGRKRLMTVGTYGVLTLEQARNKARELLVAVNDNGDPLEARQKRAQAETVKELCADYLKDAKTRKKTWKFDEQRINNHIIPAWGSRKAANIRRADVAAMHSRIGDTRPYEANRTLALISTLFNFAWTKNIIEDRDFVNPAKGIKRYSEKKRDRWVSAAELPKLAEAIDQVTNLYTRAGLWLYLLTGVRKTELLRAKWEHVDWERKEILLPDTKSENRTDYIPFYAPLSEPALAILRDLPRLRGNPYILPGLKKGAHLVNIKKAWQGVRDRATVRLLAEHPDQDISTLVQDLAEKLGREPCYTELKKAALAAAVELPVSVQDVRIHDLRRTVGSWLAQSGNSLHLIAKVLNHASVSTTAIYSRFGQDSVREALEDHGRKIMAVARGEQAEVVDIQEAKK